MQDEATNSGLPAWVRIALIGRRPKRTLIRICVLVVTCFVVFKFVLLPVRIYGGSMLPTYRENGVNFINRLAYLWHEPRRGDVVGIRFAGPSAMLMKRVVGLPGETVEFVDGRLRIDGETIDESYVKRPCHWQSAPKKLGPDEYFVVGDNREMRIQDHEHGAASRDRIVGKTLL